MAKTAKQSSLPPSPAAIWGMTLGVASLFRFYLAIPLAIAGLVISIVALKKISLGEAGGKNYALTGLISSIVSLIIWVALILVYLLILGLSLFQMSALVPY